MTRPLPFPRQGILAALWTPLDGKGKVRRRALAAHLAFLRKRNVAGVLALGSTGEFPRFTLAQREAILEIVSELAAPLPVVVNITSIRLDEAVALGRAARRLGACGVAIMPPLFFPMRQADILEFFLRVAEKVSLPFALYNFPEVASNRIGLETIAAFAEQADMVAIKQSGGEVGYHKPLIKLGRQKGFVVFSGADTRLSEMFALGAAGCVGGLANFAPELMVDIFQCHQGGRPAEAAVSAERMRSIGKVADRLTFPLNVAAGLEARGLEPGALKTVVSAESAKLYRGIVTDFRRLFKQWGL